MKNWSFECFTLWWMLLLYPRWKLLVKKTSARIARFSQVSTSLQFSKKNHSSLFGRHQEITSTHHASFRVFLLPLDEGSELMCNWSSPSLSHYLLPTYCQHHSFTQQQLKVSTNLHHFTTLWTIHLVNKQKVHNVHF